MNNKRFIKCASGITALALTFSLGMGGCKSKKSSFNFIANDKGEIVAEEGSYIDYSALEDYYVVVEVYNNILDKNEIYIANKYYRNFGPKENFSEEDTYEYINVFNNFSIVYNKNEKNTNLQYVKETPLTDYLITYDFVKYRYTYEDMQNLYELIKEDYKFENDKSISRKLTINNRL